MKTINPHSLLNTPRKIEVTKSIIDVYNIWKQLMNEKTDSGTNEFDCFVAGYFFGANPMLREKYIKRNNYEK